MLNLQIGYVSEHQHLNAVREDLSKATLVGVDTETTNLDPLVAKIRLLQISTGEKTWVLDCFKLPKQAVKEQILEPLLTNPKIVKVAQNWRFDAKMIETNFGWGLAETTSIFDTMIAAKLIDGGQYLKAGLDDLASKYLGVALDKSYQRYNWSGELYKEPIAYAGMDAAILLPLYRLLSKSIVENKLQKVAKLEFECIPALAQLELNGILIDKDLWLDIAEKGKEEMYQHELLLRQYFGDINLGSTQQICAALSEMTGMDIKSSAKQALIDLLKGYYEKPDLFGRVLDYRIPVMRLQEFNKIRKRQTSFGVDYLKRIHPKTGRIHSEFTQIETNTGRLSGREPNLMQIPQDSYMRSGFVAAPGNTMWCCVTGDSRVATDNGLKRIDQIDPISDRAVMPDGKFERIDRLLNQGFRQCREVVLSNGDRIIGSIDHRLLTVDTCGNRRWKAIEEIEVGDYLAVSHGQGISSNESLPVAVYEPSLHHTRKLVIFPDNLSPEMAEFMGMFVGDGTYKRKGIGIVCCLKDLDLVEYTSERIQSLFGAKPGRRDYRGVADLLLSRESVMGWFKELALCKDKLPEWLMTAPAAIITAFLRGYFETDGSMSGRKISLSSSRQEIIHNVKSLLTALGITSAVTTKTNKQGFTLTLLSIYAESEAVFQQTIGFISKRKREALQKRLKSGRKSVKAGGFPNLSDKLKVLSEASPWLRRKLSNVRNLDRPMTPVLARTIKENDTVLYDCLGLKDFAEHKQRYYAVVEINSKEEQEVFDLTVSATGLYIANGFINHNCDYAAIEPRITAQLSKDELYCRIFNERLDAHVANAAAIFHVGMDKVTPEQRTKAKTIGLGVTYGLQASGYAARMDIPIHIAEREVAAFYDSHPGIGAWQKEQERYYRQYNCVRSASGRVRALPHWRYNEYEARSASKNFPVQATSSDITKLAITRMYRELPSDIKLVNVIHDEILAELPENMVAEYGPEIDRIMREAAQEFIPDLPVVVEGAASKCWAKQ